MKKILIVILLSQSIYSQKVIIDSSINLSGTLPCKYIFIDFNNSIYRIDSNSKKLYKYTKEKVFVYQNIIMNPIDYIDVLNPNKIIVFFKEYNGIEIIDDKLIRKDFLDFNNEPKIKADNVNASEYDNIWIYSKELNKMTYYDVKNRRRIFETDPLIDIFGMPFEPKKIISTPTRLWLLDKRGIIEINNFGHISNIFRYTNIDYIFPFENFLSFVTKDKIIFKSKEKVVEIKNIFKDYSQIFFYQEKLFVISNKKIEIGRIVLD